jgi:hypothetical protein
MWTTLNRVYGNLLPLRNKIKDVEELVPCSNMYGQ